MIRRELVAAVCAAVATVALIAFTVRPAHATFDVQERGTSLTVTQLDTSKLIVVVNFGGGIVVNDGVTVVGYPPATDLVVRASDALTPSQVDLVMHAALPGSLKLDLPGTNDVTLRGDLATIDGSLEVKGSDAAEQILRLGEVGHPVTIKGNAKIDLKKGYDQLYVLEATSILGTFSGKGVNFFQATSLDVGGSFTADVKRDTHPISLVADEMVVGRAFKVTGGPFSDGVGVWSGAVGKGVTIKVGDGTPVGSQLVQPQFDFIGENVNVQLGSSYYGSFRLAITTVVKGSLKVASLADFGDFAIFGEIDGTSVKVSGSDGHDDARLWLVAPRAKVSVDLKDGPDRLALYAAPQFLRLDADLGAGTDTFEDGGFALPTGSTIVGVP